MVQKQAPHTGRKKLASLLTLAQMLIVLQAQYFKASAYRLGLLEEDGNLSIDGERFPFEEYYAEVHRGLGTVLSMSGRYAVDFTVGPPSSA